MLPHLRVRTADAFVLPRLASTCQLARDVSLQARTARSSHRQLPAVVEASRLRSDSSERQRQQAIRAQAHTGLLLASRRARVLVCYVHRCVHAALGPPHSTVLPEIYTRV